MSTNPLTRTSRRPEAASLCTVNVGQRLTTLSAPILGEGLEARVTGMTFIFRSDIQSHDRFLAASVPLRLIQFSFC